MKALFLAWQDSDSDYWFPIGKLTFNGKEYQFSYINGALEFQQKYGFQPLPSFPDLHKIYTSQKLFPLFSNRVIPRSRPDYPELLQWLNISQHEDDPITLLARTGGKRVTDNFEVFPCLKPDKNGLYRIHFLAGGLRFFSPETIERIDRLQVGEDLYLAHKLESRRLQLITKDDRIVGDCPRYLDDFAEIIQQHPESVRVKVDRVNQPPTPLQFRLLCEMTADWSKKFRPFSSQIYQPIAEYYVIQCGSRTECGSDRLIKIK